ncbi:hypothetical protein FRB95_007273 [Tulasnella sp. JGI-2019a]|nr:hypothetical protein FRB95_007273 [Tulasnella sp. JGI-2019a]
MGVFGMSYVTAVEADVHVNEGDCSSERLYPTLSTLGFSNMTFTNNQVAAGIFKELFYNATFNYVQVMSAAVRLEFGNKCPNFLTDPSYTNRTFIETPTLTPDTYKRYFPSAGFPSHSFYSFITGSFNESDCHRTRLPLNATDPVYITTPYLCHKMARKEAAQLVVSIAVAMYSMFFGCWGMFQFFAPRFFTRNKPNANHCIGHIELGAEAGERSEDGRPSLNPGPQVMDETQSMDGQPSQTLPLTARSILDSRTSHVSTLASNHSLARSEALQGANGAEGYPKRSVMIGSIAPIPITLDVEVESGSVQETTGPLGDDPSSTVTWIGPYHPSPAVEAPQSHHLSDDELDGTAKGVTREGPKDVMSERGAEIHIGLSLEVTDRTA